MIIEIEIPINIERILCKAKYFGLCSSADAAQAIVTCHNWRRSFNVAALSEVEKHELAKYRKDILAASLKNSSLFI